MEITVRLLASYRQYLPVRHDKYAGYPLHLGCETTVRAVLDRLPIPGDDAYTFLVNGRHAWEDQALQDGDTLSVFPAVGGG
jgi:molybdopterin converting factor small subunit